MEEIVLLTLMATFTLVAALCSIVFNRFKLPPLIGYLVAGIIVANTIEVPLEWKGVVDILSDIGLVMLMFSIGMEINLSKAKSVGVLAAKITVVQLPLLLVGGMLFGPALGFNFIQSVALGAIISGSSNAVVIAVLKAQGTLSKEHLEVLILVTIMEDIGQVIMLSMITPLLAGGTMDVNELIVMIIFIIIFMVVSIPLGIKLMPRVLNWLSKSVSKEVIFIFSVGLAFGMGLLATKVGLSMAIGAFLLGIMVSPCSVSEEIHVQVEPMKDLFMAMFFISVGMEIDAEVIVQNIPLILIICMLFVVLKSLSVFVGYWMCRYDGKAGFTSAISLVAMGEFAFIISHEAVHYGAFTESMHTAVVGAALLSMVLLPYLSRNADAIWNLGTNHAPRGAKLLGRFLTNARNDIYSMLEVSSQKSKAAYTKSMTKAYSNLILIAVLTVLFCWFSPMLAQWLMEEFGGRLAYWESFLSIVNFFVLLAPITRLVTSLKRISGALLERFEKIGHRRGEFLTRAGYNAFSKINSIYVALAINFLIMFLVPNSLKLTENLICIAIAIVLFFLVFRKARKDMEHYAMGLNEAQIYDEDMNELQ